MRSFRRSLLDVAIAVVVMAGVLVAAAGLWFRHDVYGDRSLPARDRDVVIPQGSTFAQVTQQLRREGVVAHPFAFRILARLRHQDAEVKAGEFHFTAHETSDEILRRLIEGGAQIADWVTIPEGFTARQIAQRLADRNLGAASAFATAFLHTPYSIDGQRAKNLEGFLFPDTYLIPVQTTPGAVARIMTDEFKRQLPPNAAGRARRLGYTIPQVVTLASLVEREAKSDDERALMAGVYYNRLRRGMPLEVDATIEYIFPEHKTTITKADLEIDSPYNTYRHAGLPPTPIASPGRPSLLAAFEPRSSEYLYYVYKGNGHHAFAKTLAEHNANVERYLK